MTHIVVDKEHNLIKVNRQLFLEVELDLNDNITKIADTSYNGNIKEAVQDIVWCINYRDFENLFSDKLTTIIEDEATEINENKE